MRLFVYFVRMGREMYPKKTWQARIQGRDPKEDFNRLGNKGYRRFGRKEELNVKE
jgi:hypothetical protein